MAIVFSVLVAACSKPTDTVIPSDMSQWDKELAPVAKKLTDEERQLLAGYVARMKLAGVFDGGKTDIPLGTTIGQAIQQQKAWLEEKAKEEAEAAALKEKLRAEREALIAKIRDAVTVTLIEKTERFKDYEERRFSDQQVFVVGIQNNSQRTLQGVSGELKFVDLFGKEVGATTFRITENIAPGGTHRWVGVRDYNQFLTEHRAVWNLEEGKYTTEFVPEAVLFADGTKLVMPNE